MTQVTSSIKTGKTFTFEFDDLPPASQQALIQYGAQRWINDRVNSTTKSKEITEEEAINQLGADILERLQKGILGRQGGATIRDPRLAFMVDYIAEVKHCTKKAVKEYVKEAGAPAIIEIFEASDKAQDEYARRKEAVALDDITLDGLDI